MTATDAATWDDVLVGPLTLPAPGFPPRQIEARHGHLWQWVGDGEPLLSLSVASRETATGTPRAALGHLGWEVEQVVASLDTPDRAQVQRRDAVHVAGALGASAAVVRGARQGLAVRNELVVCTEGRHLHVVRVIVADSEAGQVTAARVVQHLQVHTWVRPVLRDDR